MADSGVCMIRLVCVTPIGDKWPFRDMESETADDSHIRGLSPHSPQVTEIYRLISGDFQPS